MYAVLAVNELHALEEDVNLWDDIEKLMLKWWCIVLKTWNDVLHAKNNIFQYDRTMVLTSSPI